MSSETGEIILYFHLCCLTYCVKSKGSIETFHEFSQNNESAQHLSIIFIVDNRRDFVFVLI